MTGPLQEVISGARKVPEASRWSRRRGGTRSHRLKHPAGQRRELQETEQKTWCRSRDERELRPAAAVGGQKVVPAQVLAQCLGQDKQVWTIKERR